MSLSATYIFSPHGMHSVHRCGLLLHMSICGMYLCVCPIVCLLSHAKMAEPTKMLFSVYTQVGQRWAVHMGAN